MYYTCDRTYHCNNLFAMSLLIADSRLNSESHYRPASSRKVVVKTLTNCPLRLPTYTLRAILQERSIIYSVRYSKRVNRAELASNVFIVGVASTSSE